jgi:transposase
VSAYYRNGDSVIAAQRVFRRGQVPSAHVIRTWVRNFEETGSALKKNPSVPD